MIKKKIKLKISQEMIIEVNADEYEIIGRTHELFPEMGEDLYVRNKENGLLISFDLVGNVYNAVDVPSGGVSKVKYSDHDEPLSNPYNVCIKEKSILKQLYKMPLTE